METVRAVCVCVSYNSWRQPNWSWGQCSGPLVNKPLGTRAVNIKASDWSGRTLQASDWSITSTGPVTAPHMSCGLVTLRELNDDSSHYCHKVRCFDESMRA